MTSRNSSITACWARLGASVHCKPEWARVSKLRTTSAVSASITSRSRRELLPKACSNTGWGPANPPRLGHVQTSVRRRTARGGSAQIRALASSTSSGWDNLESVRGACRSTRHKCGHGAPGRSASLYESHRGCSSNGYALLLKYHILGMDCSTTVSTGCRRISLREEVKALLP
jgi:hypothetical protein